MKLKQFILQTNVLDASEIHEENLVLDKEVASVYLKLFYVVYFTYHFHSHIVTNPTIHVPYINMKQTTLFWILNSTHNKDFLCQTMYLRISHNSSMYSVMCMGKFHTFYRGISYPELCSEKQWLM